MSHNQHPKPDSSTCVTRIQDAVRLALTNLRLQPQTPVLVALSGGPDSLCLTDATLAVAAQIRIKPVIAHLNHCLRGVDSDNDAAFVKAYASEQGFEAIVESVNVKQLALTERVSVEVAARHARYSFLQQTALKCGARHILIGHNSDDQVETILLRMIRGTGINGLRGMQVITPLIIETTPLEHPIWLVRPLLSVPRSEINDYCQGRGLNPRTDVTNADSHHTRNRIRLELLPLLETINPGIRKVLWHLSETAHTDIEIVEYATQQAYVGVLLSENTSSVTLNRKAWQELPSGLQRTTLRQAILHVRKNMVDLKFAGIEEARDVLNSSAVTGQIAILSDARITVSPTSFTVTTELNGLVH